MPRPQLFGRIFKTNVSCHCLQVSDVEEMVERANRSAQAVQVRMRSWGTCAVPLVNAAFGRCILLYLMFKREYLVLQLLMHAPAPLLPSTG